MLSSMPTRSWTLSLRLVTALTSEDFFLYRKCSYYKPESLYRLLIPKVNMKYHKIGFRSKMVLFSRFVNRVVPFDSVP